MASFPPPLYHIIIIIIITTLCSGYTSYTQQVPIVQTKKEVKSI